MEWWHALIVMLVCAWVGIIFMLAQFFHRLAMLDKLIHEENKSVPRDALDKSKEIQA